MGRNVEVYVDDMLLKSVQAPDHVSDLKEIFDTLRRYEMKLKTRRNAPLDSHPENSWAT
jgi:hypothetical protein